MHARYGLVLIAGSMLLLGGCSEILNMGSSTATPPHLEKRGPVTQLIVDDKPFLILGGEVHNSSSSTRSYMQPIWPKLAKANVNTVLTPLSWEIIEPKEGQFDFKLVDQLIRDARQSELHIIFLWLGSWKNGTSRYEADWVKSNQERFPRIANKDGRTLEILSTFSEETRDADTRAYVALMRHIREIDAGHDTVLMMQMQNEVGVLGDSRDRSPAANLAFAGPVPRELMDYLVQHKDNLLPEFRKIWDAAGNKSSGTWEEVFGKGPATDEIFMAWNYARFMNHMAAAGKAEYPIPVFVNAWIVQPEDKGPGDYPSGGPQAHVHDLSRAGAPQIDLLAPDIYLPDFPGILAMYSRSGNPVLIPEAFSGASGAANAFYAFGHGGAMGYSPFAIEDRPDPDGPLAKAYGALSQLSSLITAAQARSMIGAVWLNKDKTSAQLQLGTYTVNIELRKTRGSTTLPAAGYAIAICTGPDEYYVSGTDVQVTFSPKSSDGSIAGILSAEEGTITKGNWTASRRLNGDEVQLKYELSEAAAVDQSGAGLRFEANGPNIQRVVLYRYK